MPIEDDESLENDLPGEGSTAEKGGKQKEKNPSLDLDLELDNDSGSVMDKYEEADKQDTQVEEEPQDSGQNEEEEQLQQQGEDQEEGDGDRQQHGQRAQKRIRKLVQDRNTVREENETLKQRLAELEQERNQFREVSELNQEAALKQTKERLQNDLLVLKEAVKRARLEDDDAFADSVANLTKVQAQLNSIEAFEKQREARKARGTSNEGEQGTKKTEEQPRQQQQQQIKLHPQTEKWFSQNKNWFGVDADKTAEVRRIGEELEAEGYDPNEMPEAGNEFNEYFMIVNARMAKKFPRKPAANGNQQKVTPGSRGGAPARNKGQPSLNPRQEALIKKLGISRDAYIKSLKQDNA